MDKFVPIATAAKTLGVSRGTLRRWEAAGLLVPDRTSGGHRRYDLDVLRYLRDHASELPGSTLRPNPPKLTRIRKE